MKRQLLKRLINLVLRKSVECERAYTCAHVYTQHERTRLHCAIIIGADHKEGANGAGEIISSRHNRSCGLNLNAEHKYGA